MPEAEPLPELVENYPVQLHVLHYPGAETVLLLHGGPGTPDAMPGVARPLAHRYQVLYFDQRGTGGSSCPGCTYRIADHEADILAILDYFDVEKVHIFGHSWGGLLAQLFAWHHPGRVASLFLCSPSPGTGLHWRLMEMELAAYLVRKAGLLEIPALAYEGTMSRIGTDLGARQLFSHFHAIAHRGFPATAPPPAQLTEINAEAVNKTRESILHHPPLPEVLNVDFPVTLTFGKHDTDIFKMSRKHVIRRFPEAAIHEIPDAGHFAFLHNPEAFFPVLAQHFGLYNPEG